jgi:uncharacterized membrane protein
MALDWMGLLGVIGCVGIGVALLTLGLLSKRLGKVTRTPRYDLGFYLAALLMAISGLARLLNSARGPDVAAALSDDPLWVFLYTGLPGIAITLSLVICWRYWSWLLAERS